MLTSVFFSFLLFFLFVFSNQGKISSCNILFGRALNYSGKEFRCIVIGYSFTLARKRYDNHHCHNKPKTVNRAGVWMTSCPEEIALRICGF